MFFSERKWKWWPYLNRRGKKIHCSCFHCQIQLLAETTRIWNPAAPGRTALIPSKFYNLQILDLLSPNKTMAMTLLCEIILSWKEDNEIPVDTIPLFLLFLWQYFYDTTHYCSHSRTVKFKEFKTDAFCLQGTQDSRHVKYYQAFVCCTISRMKIFMFSTQVDPKRTAICHICLIFRQGHADRILLLFKDSTISGFCWT